MKRLLSLILLFATAFTFVFSSACTGDGGDDVTSYDTVGVTDGDPAEIPFDITELLLHTRDNFDRSFDFTVCTVGTCKTNKYLTLTGNSFMRDKSKGLIGSTREIGAVGMAQELSAFPYTARSYIYACGDNRTEGSVFAGILCTSADQCHTQGGLWFSFDKSTVKAYVAGKLDCTVTESLAFDCANGVNVVFKGEKNEISLYANDTHIASVYRAGTRIILKDHSGSEIAACDGGFLWNDVSHGYFRVETNKSSCVIGSIGLSHTSSDAFVPDDTVYAFMKGREYSFKDKQAFMHLQTRELNGKLYADAEALFEMFDFTYAVDGGVITAKRDNAVLSLTPDMPVMTVNGEEKPFVSVKSIDGGLYMSIEALAKILGYDSVYDSESGICTVFGANSEISDEKKLLVCDSFRLYDEIVFNYDDVECVRTGVGKYDKSSYDDRIVGISYTTWHRNSKTWWKNTWGTPLFGEYESSQEDVLRYHAELLAAADVDFVFVDWSNNTTIISESTLETAEDFRMIEYSTYEMFRVWSTVPNAPKIALFLGPGHAGQENVNNGKHQMKVDQVYSSFVDNEEYGDMYYYYLGKPLLICYGATPNQYGAQPKWTDERFTVRWMTGYVGQQSNLFDRRLCSDHFWSWEERSPQTYTQLNGVVETVTCSAATRGENDNNNELRSNGATLKKQVQRACDLGATMILFTTWNEWTSSEQKNPERSRDLEPSVEYGTFYYDLMCQQIRKFKGKV